MGTPRWIGAVAGVAAGAVALAVAELIAIGTGPGSAPLVGVGAVVIDHVPPWGKDFAIAVFGTHDKTALLIGTTVLLLGFAAVLGVLALRRRWIGYAGIGVFAVVGVLAAVTRPGAGSWAALPALLGAGAGALTLRLLLTRPAAGPAALGEQRRAFLSRTGATVAGAAVAGFLGQYLVQRRDVSAARAQVRLPVPVDPAPTSIPGADPGVPELAPFLTPANEFYRIDTALAVPQIDPRDWRLKVTGRVRTPFELTFDELLAMPMVERYVTLTCVSNEIGGDLIGNARWLGVPLKGLLERAGPLPGADQVIGRAVDGFTVGAPTEVLTDGRDAMLAVGMNGAPLPIEHGFPVRMVVPGLYGYVSATKWLAELELSSFADYSAYWVPRGWSARAPIKTGSRTDTPRDGSAPRAGTVTVAGVAWAQHRGISKVEVQVDDGDWQAATLGSVPSVDTWRLWSWDWAATAGTHRITVRATDNAGEIQTGRRADPAPDGATGWHTVRVEVR